MIKKITTEYPDFDDLKYKVNEIIDTVNSIVSVQEKLIDSRFVVETKHEEPADSYAEQRKWIGKLCIFWDDNYKITKHFGILTRIDETSIVKYEAENGFWYCACEPVKPNDDIIYKGE